MYLTLRTDSDSAEIQLLETTGVVIESDRWQAGRQLSGQLLGHIQQLLDRRRTQWGDLSGVVVYRGPGSFTGLRIGVSVANAIAYAQSIPIVGTGGEEWARLGARRLSAGETDLRVMPEYGGDAHITRPGRKPDRRRSQSA